MRIHYKEGTDELMKQLTAAVQDYFRQTQSASLWAEYQWFGADIDDFKIGR